MSSLRTKGQKMRRISNCLLLVVLFLVPAGSRSEVNSKSGNAMVVDSTEYGTLPTLDRILERYIEVLGGRNAIERLTTRMISGCFVHDMRSRQPPVYEVETFEFYAKIPDKNLRITHAARGTMMSGYNSKNISGIISGNVSGNKKAMEWEQNIRGEMREVPGRDLKLAFIINPQNALKTKEYFPGMKVVGMDIRDGRKVISIESSGGITFHFDVETGFLTGIGHYFRLEDYQEIDGVKFPMRIVNSRKGGSSTYFIDRISHNDTMDDTLFEMPESSGSPLDEYVKHPIIAPHYVVLSAFNVNIRTGPSLDSFVVTLGRKGNLFLCTGENGDWFEIRMFSGVPRYISKSYVYPLASHQIPGRPNLRLPTDLSKQKSFMKGVQRVIDETGDEAIKHRSVLLDRLMLDHFNQYRLETILYVTLGIKEISD